MLRLILLNIVFVLLLLLSLPVSGQDIGSDMKDLFTFKKKHCKLAHIYSGVSAGQVVYTENHGKAIVKNYRIGNKIQVFYRQTSPNQPTRTRFLKVTQGVKNLVVIVPKDPQSDVETASASDLKTVTISQRETKHIMIQSLVLRRKYKWIIRMYPEEKANLRFWIKKFSNTPLDPNIDPENQDIEPQDGQTGA